MFRQKDKKFIVITRTFFKLEASTHSQNNNNNEPFCLSVKCFLVRFFPLLSSSKRFYLTSHRHRQSQRETAMAANVQSLHRHLPFTINIHHLKSIDQHTVEREKKRESYWKNWMDWILLSVGCMISFRLS